MNLQKFQHFGSAVGSGKLITQHFVQAPTERLGNRVEQSSNHFDDGDSGTTDSQSIS